MDKTKTMTIYLGEDKEEIITYCQLSGRNVSATLRVAMKQYMKNNPIRIY